MALHADLILANRAYLDHDRPEGGRASAISGELLSAVRPVVAPWDGSGTTWIGAGRGAYDREFVDPAGYEFIETGSGPLRHRRLFFDAPAWDAHYGRVSNSFLWPLFHLVRAGMVEAALYYPTPAIPAPGEWAGYTAVNRAFAEAAATEPAWRTAWIHDYQLALVPALLRERGRTGRIGFFLHTPFPDLAVVTPLLGERGLRYLALVVGGILGADLAGFQTAEDATRFCQAAVALCGATAHGGNVQAGGRTVRIAAFPVGIDAGDVEAALPAAPPPARGTGPLVVGLERSDFTKGIPERLRAVAACHSEGLAFAYTGVAAPTRSGVSAYDAFEQVVEREVAAARQVASGPRQSFDHRRATLSWPEVVALQQRADVVFTSSLADGMNVVPLQAAIAQAGRPPADRAVIIAGRDTGVARTYAELEGEGLAIVDPLDHQGMTRTLTRAVRRELAGVSDRFIAEVRRRDAAAWANHYLEMLEGDPC